MIIEIHEGKIARKSVLLFCLQEQLKGIIIFRVPSSIFKYSGLALAIHSAPDNECTESRSGLAQQSCAEPILNWH